MGRSLIALSLIILLFLAAGTWLAPTSPMFWLAASSQTIQITRLVLASLLFIQLITRPPRQVALRLLSGIVAVGVGVWAIQATYLYQMAFLDTLALLGASLAMGITALERRPTTSVISEPKLKFTT